MEKGGKRWIAHGGKTNLSLFWQNIFFSKISYYSKKLGDGHLGSISIAHGVSVEWSSMAKDVNASGAMLKVYVEMDATTQTKKSQCSSTFCLYDGNDMSVGAICECFWRVLLIPSSRHSPIVNSLPFHLAGGAYHCYSQPCVALESREQRHLLLLLLSCCAGISGYFFFVKKIDRVWFMEWGGSENNKRY